jgi:hypothetical protein
LGGESPLQRFIGSTKPFEGKETEVSRTEANAASVPSDSTALKAEVSSQPASQQVLDVPAAAAPPQKPKVVAPALHEMRDDDELSF